jgi:hypothetical protein
MDVENRLLLVKSSWERKTTKLISFYFDNGTLAFFVKSLQLSQFFVSIAVIEARLCVHIGFHPSIILMRLHVREPISSCGRGRWRFRCCFLISTPEKPRIFRITQRQVLHETGFAPGTLLNLQNVLATQAAEAFVLAKNPFPQRDHAGCRFDL